MLSRDAMTSEFREIGDHIATNADWTRRHDFVQMTGTWDLGWIAAARGRESARKRADSGVSAVLPCSAPGDDDLRDAPKPRAAHCECIRHREQSTVAVTATRRAAALEPPSAAGALESSWACFFRRASHFLPRVASTCRSQRELAVLISRSSADTTQYDAICRAIGVAGPSTVRST
jgi:hypothetical protein